MCSTLVLAFFSYQHLYNLLQVVGARHRVLLPGLGIAAIAIMIMVMRTRRPLEPVTRASNVVAAFLVLMAFVQIAHFKIRLSDDDVLAKITRRMRASSWKQGVGARKRYRTSIILFWMPIPGPTY